MKLIDLLEESLGVLKNNKMRTGLSILGIVIGISSVIALISIGQASQKSTVSRISQLGSNLLTIRPGSISSGFMRERGGAVTLTYADALAIAKDSRVTTIEKVTAEYSANGKVSRGKNAVSATISGVTPDYFVIRNIELATGIGFSQSDMELKSKVAVLGPTVAEDIFGTKIDPIGQKIKINGNMFRVGGITKEKGLSGFNNTDETVYIPLLTAQKAIFGVDYVTNIFVIAKDSKDTAPAQNQVGYLLLERHKLKSPAEADFYIMSSADLLETVSEVTGTFTSLLAGIAGISLVVGGIGIMNIMLVTVTERTQEIGIRKALGAKRKAIVNQFLIESTILTLAGGVLGTLIGILASWVLTSQMNLPSGVSFGSVLLAVGVSCIIGVVFGWYPARRASRLQPVEALRYE